jgi:hypothetical protein
MRVSMMPPLAIKKGGSLVISGYSLQGSGGRGGAFGVTAAALAASSGNVLSAKFLFFFFLGFVLPFSLVTGDGPGKFHPFSTSGSLTSFPLPVHATTRANVTKNAKPFQIGLDLDANKSASFLFLTKHF